MSKQKMKVEDKVQQIWDEQLKNIYESGKPCHILKYCPYGPLVEEFPLQDTPRDKKSCTTFGHDCPVYHSAEPMAEDEAFT